MDQETRLVELIDRIYAAGTGESDWDEVTTPVRELLGCSVVALHADDLARQRSIALSHPGLDPEEARKYESYYATRNLWMQRASARLCSGRLLHGEDLVSRRELLRTEYWNDFGLPNDLGHAVAVCLHQEPDLIALFSLFKAPDGDGFTGDEVRMVRLLRPHLRRAIAVSRSFQRMRAESHLAEAALDTLGSGAALLDADGCVTHLNGRLEALLRMGDGVFLARGRLRFSHSPSQRRMDELLTASPLEATGGAVRVPRPSGGADYEATLIPLPVHVDGPFLPERASGGWLLRVRDPGRPLPRFLRHLKSLHGLTDAEARVANLLADGKTLRDVARARGTSVNTVKSQTGRIYEKLGVHTRAELVRRVTAVAGGGVGTGD